MKDSFLEKVTKKMRTSESTLGLYLGTTEAEGETRKGQSLLDYFEDYMKVLEDIKNGKFIISGRKGSGKSAIVKYFHDNSSEENELYTETVKPSDINLEKAIQYISIPDDDSYTLLYEWIILTKFVKMLLRTNDVRGTKEYCALEQFQRKNSGLLNVDDWKTLNFQQDESRKVNFSALKSVFNAEIGKNIKTTSIKADFMAFIPALREIVVKMLHFPGLERFSFYIMFDDLDENFKLSKATDKKRLLKLIRITRSYNTDYLLKTNSMLMIFIRDDVSTQLDGVDTDRAKLFSSYETRINWYEHYDIAHEENTLLRKFINKRIGLAFETQGRDYNVEDPWLSLVDNTACDEYLSRTAFKFILDFTFYLPRDLLLVFKDLEKKNMQIPIKPDDIKSLLRDYVTRKEKEITDELLIQFDDDKDTTDLIISSLRDLSKTNNYSMKDVLVTLNKFGLDENIFNILLDYNLLIPKDKSGKVYFRYRDQQWEGSIEDYVFTLPKCLYCYFYPNKI